MKRLATLCMGLGLAVGCGESSPSGVGSSARAQFLSAFVDGVALPTYRAIDVESARLQTALEGLAEAPGEGALASTQEAWRAARAEWKRQDAFRIGPADVLSSHFKIDQSADLAGIDALLLGTAAVDEAAAKVLGANRKGLLAMEYLLFDPVGGNAAVLQTLQAAEGGERRRIYLRSLGRVMRSDVAELLAAWEPGGGNYASQISQAGQGSQAFGTQKTAVDALVNRLIFSAESAELKLSRPLGREAGGTPQPNQEEARFSDNSLRDLLEVLEGIRRVYVGPSESGSDVGLSDVLNSQNAELDARMVSELGAARQALSSVPAPLRTALSGSSAQVESARASLAALHATLATEVASNLGVTLKFNDNDGD